MERKTTNSKFGVSSCVVCHFLYFDITTRQLTRNVATNRQKKKNQRTTNKKQEKQRTHQQNNLK